MRILTIRFANLNALSGQWQIDLQDPAFVGNGIFAITGPTGAGKSTILDAICLALYGRTPRLNIVSQSNNEIMSRQSGHCFAEVVFETPAGRFRSHWSQRRAREKVDGKLQAPKRELADADSGTIIASSVKKVADEVERLTGMDFDRFTRSMMLAQGGFDTLLKADAEQKSKILEQITGSEIYSEISRQVFMRQKEERNKLDLLVAETSGIMLLEPEQEKEIQQNLEAQQKQDQELSAKLSQSAQAIAWLTGINSLQEELRKLADEATKLQADSEAFTAQRLKLEQARKAASLDGSYAGLAAIRKQQSDDKAELELKQKALPELETAAKAQAQALEAAEQLSRKAKENLKAAAPLIQEIRSLDQKLAQQIIAVQEAEKRCTKSKAKIDADKLARKQKQNQRADAEKLQLAADAYLKANACDEWLIGGLAGVEAQLGNLVAKQEEMTQKQAEGKKADRALQQAAKKLADNSKQNDLRKQELEAAEKNLQLAQKTLRDLLGERLLREYRAEKESLLREMAFLAKIAELEDHRVKLKDGQACPLCGATEHPFAQGNVPLPDATEEKIAALTQLIDKAEAQEARIKKLQEAEAAARTRLNDSEKQKIQLANAKLAAEKSSAELQNSLKTLHDGFSDLKQALTKKLEPLGISEIAETQLSSLLEALKRRLQKWQDQVDEKTKINAQITAIDSEIKRLEGVIETQSAALAEEKKILAQVQEEQAATKEERQSAYAEKKPDDEEKRLNSAIAEAEKAEKQAAHLHSAQQQKLTTAKAQVESLKNRIEQNAPELKKLESDFASTLMTTGFANEQAFLAARLTKEEREALSLRAKELDRAQTDLAARQNDRETRLAAERDKKLSDKSLDELQPQFTEDEKALKDLRDAMAAVKHKLSENTAAKARIKEKQSAIEAQKKACQRWERLNEFIGSSDGKKFRNFAQGLTFEIMIAHANQQLQKMSDRYLLLHDRDQVLGLKVIDNYQAGEMRSTKNLSGGESFIVSLALALGLAQMSSQHIRVDSLFLDEGFGSLDDEALETALETLAGLFQQGKLIGLISHVAALKERIGTQIQLQPQAGGKSHLYGPGCTKLA